MNPSCTVPQHKLYVAVEFAFAFENLYFYMLDNLWPNSSIFWRLSGFGRSKHRCPDSLIVIISDHGRLFQLIWRETESFPNQLKDIIRESCALLGAQNTSTGFFRCGRAAAVLRVPLQWPNSHSLMLLKDSEYWWSLTLDHQYIHTQFYLQGTLRHCIVSNNHNTYNCLSL